MAMLLSTVVVAQQKVINFYKEGFFQIPLYLATQLTHEQGKRSNGRVTGSNPVVATISISW